MKVNFSNFPWNFFTSKIRSQRVQFTTSPFSWYQSIIKLLFLYQIKSFFSRVSRYLSNQLYLVIITLPLCSILSWKYWQRSWPGHLGYRQPLLPTNHPLQSHLIKIQQLKRLIRASHLRYTHSMSSTRLGPFWCSEHSGILAHRLTSARPKSLVTRKPVPTTEEDQGTLFNHALQL